jgi:ABC-type polysaccharide/polyol phosphate export permease
MSATSEVPAAFRHAAGERSPRRLIAEAISDIRSRQRLVRYLVQADVRKRGADTVLGNLWWVLDPILQMAVYVVFVTIVAPRTTPDYPLFIFAAILPWKWFTSSISDATSSIVSHDTLIKQIQFPKIVLPTAAVVAGVVSFTFGLVALAGLMLFYPDRISPYLVLIPVIASVQFVFTLACAYLVAAGNVFFRDLGNVESHFMRLWWFLSPGLYSLAALDELNIFKNNPALKSIVAANPFAILFEAYRMVIYGTPRGAPGLPDFRSLGVLLIASILLLAFTTFAFKRLEPNFAKVV